MADQTTTVLIDVQVQASEALKRQEELKIAIEAQKEALKKLEVEQGKTSQVYIAEEATLKQLNNQLAANGRVLTQMADSNREAAGAYAALEQRMYEATRKANDLGAAYGKNSQVFKDASTEANRLKQELKDIDSASGNNQRRVGDYAGELGKLPGMFGKLGGAVQGGTEAMKLFNASNPVGWIIIVVNLFSSLVNWFKSFAPVADAVANVMAKVSAAFSVVKNLVIDVTTGQKSLASALSSASGEMERQTREAERLAEAQRDLDDRTEAAAVSQEKLKNKVNELILQSKNRTLSEKERMKLIDQALALENDAYKQKKKLADDQVKIIQDELIQQGGLNAFEAAELRKKGVAYARYKENQKNLDDATIKRLKDALVAQQQIEGESIALREKAMNRRDQLSEKEESDNQKRIEKAEKDREKRKAKEEKEAAKKIADEQKRVNQLKENADKAIEALEIELQMFQLKQEKAAAKTTQTNEQVYADKIALINEQYLNEGLKLEEKLANEQITQAEYDAAALLLLQQKNTLTAKENQAFEQAERDRKLAAASIDLQNEMAIAEMRGQSLLDLKIKQLDAEKTEELRVVGLTEEQKYNIEQKYVELKKKLNREEIAAKLDLASNFAGNIAEIFGKQTKIGKLAASAQIAVDSAKGAMAAFTSTASIPVVGPILGAAAAGAVIAKGVKSIKDVWAVKSGLPGDSGGGGASVSTATASASPVANVTGAIVSRNSGQVQQAATSQAVSKAMKANPQQPVLVTNDLTTALNQKVQIKSDNSL